MGQASLMSQVLPQDEGNRFRMPDLPPAGGEAVNYGYTPTAMATPSSMGMPSLNLQAPEFGIVDPTYLAQLAILNQGAGSFVPSTAPVAPMGLLGSGLESQEQFRANAPLLGGAPMIADWRAYSPNRSANALLNQAIAQGGGSYEAQTGTNFYNDPNSYTGGLVEALFGGQAPAPVVDMTFRDGQPSPTFGFVDYYGPGVTAMPSPGMGYVSDNSYETGGGGGFDFSGGFADAGGGSFNYSADTGYDF